MVWGLLRLYISTLWWSHISHHAAEQRRFGLHGDWRTQTHSYTLMHTHNKLRKGRVTSGPVSGELYIPVNLFRSPSSMMGQLVTWWHEDMTLNPPCMNRVEASGWALPKHKDGPCHPHAIWPAASWPPHSWRLKKRFEDQMKNAVMRVRPKDLEEAAVRGGGSNDGNGEDNYREAGEVQPCLPPPPPPPHIQAPPATVSPGLWAIRGLTVEGSGAVITFQWTTKEE